VGLFTLAKRKGLFSGEEIVKKQTTLTTARVTGILSMRAFLIGGGSETRVAVLFKVLVDFCVSGIV
jgi:hypothetical protein